MNGITKSKESCLQKSSHDIKYSGFTNHISLPRKDISVLDFTEILLYKHNLPNTKFMRQQTIRERKRGEKHGRFLTCSTLMRSKCLNRNFKVIKIHNYFYRTAIILNIIFCRDAMK